MHKALLFVGFCFSLSESHLKLFSQVAVCADCLETTADFVRAWQKAQVSLEMEVNKHRN